MGKTLLLLATAFAFSAHAQESPNVKYGKISAAAFAQTSYPIDTSASAVVLYENGNTSFKGNSKASFSFEFKLYRRIHILNKNGYDNATVIIPLYASGDEEEKLDDLRAVTYNLENGKVVETKLDKGSVFKEKRNKNLVIKKFTLPDVKEGSIIEYEYKITSDFLFDLQPWSFQGDIPRLWSEFKLDLPQFLNYVLISQGDQHYTVKDQNDFTGHFTVTEPENTGTYAAPQGGDRINIDCSVTSFRWAMKDMPALKEEAFTSTLKNYVAKLDFQLSAYREPYTPQKVMPDWPDLSARLLKREDFGQEILNYDWLTDYVASITKGASGDKQKAIKLYEYVRDNFTCTDHSQLYPEKPLRTIYKEKNGGVAEINLLLTAMLRTVGVASDPVILSTKEHGLVYPRYPVIGRFNYVITQAHIEGNDILLDATYPKLGFGMLNTDCYNGQARVINAAATELNLPSEGITETERVAVSMAYDKTDGWVAKTLEVPGYYSSLRMREKIQAKGEEAFFKELAEDWPNDVTVEKTSIDSLSNYDVSLALQYQVKLGTDKADIIYLNPIMGTRYKQNPFKSADREYPVEMPYRINEVYTLSLAIPDGYVADEMPKAVTLKLNDAGDAVYEYKISQSNGSISLRCWLQVNRTTFQPSEYPNLREFFNRLVAKQNEQIVFKKKA